MAHPQFPDIKTPQYIDSKLITQYIVFQEEKLICLEVKVQSLTTFIAGASPQLHVLFSVCVWVGGGGG